MASTEIIKRAIASGRVYDDLPPRIKNMITPYEWRSKVKEHCIQRGLPWASSLACTVVGQQEYYDDLLRSYKTWMRLFPYHLSDFLCRVCRITCFKYYLDMVANMLKEERSYDRMPNFTAADALSVLGIGRNEYISALNACKARRLLWRVNLNRDSIVREQLPSEPTTVQRLEPWWRVSVVNIGEAEYRELGEEELAHLKTAALPVTAAGGDIRVRDFNPDVLRGLLRKGLAYLEVPVDPEDRFAIPPLEGFVSNKNSEAGDAAADPLEGLLYSVFVANSQRMTVAELGAILGVDLANLQAAIGMASRLGFATRVTDTYPLLQGAGLPSRGKLEGRLAADDPSVHRTGDLSDDSTATAAAVGVAAATASSSGLSAAGGGGGAALSGDGGDEAAAQRVSEQRSLQLAEGLMGTQAGARGVGGVAVLMDAEATGYLMMGALSPGLKRHSVTLFEGGRVTGEEVMKELVTELWASYAAGQRFEGEMLRLTHYSAALATLLEAVRASAGPGLSLELLRKESLAGLAPTTACKVLNHAYCAVVPVNPLPPPVLPLSPFQPGPAYYGPTLEAASPWLHLALYSAARCGPQSYVFVCGQRVWRLPHPLDRCTHAMLTPWDEDTEHGRARAMSASDGQILLVEASFLLYTLNELLSRTAVLVQPLDCTEPDWTPEIVDVPLPLPSEAREAAAAAASRSSLADPWFAAPTVVVPCVRRCSGELTQVPLQPTLLSALRKLGLISCVGHLRLLRLQTPHHHPPHPHQASVISSGANGTGNLGAYEPHASVARQQRVAPETPSTPPPAPALSPSSSMSSLSSAQGRTPSGLPQSLTISGGAGAAGPAPHQHAQNPNPNPQQGPGQGQIAGRPFLADPDQQCPQTPAAGGNEPPAPCRSGLFGFGFGFGGVGGATGGDGKEAGGCGGPPWLPLCVQLGVPLYSLELCKAVCGAAEAAGFLSAEGRQAQLQSQKLLQIHLTKLLTQYSHCSQDGSYGSFAGPPGGPGELISPHSPGWGGATPPSGGGAAAGVSGGGGGGYGGFRGPPAGAAAGPAVGGRLAPVLPLPALNLSFDGNSLQPIRLQDSVQGLGCLCQA